MDATKVTRAVIILQGKASYTFESETAMLLMPSHSNGLAGLARTYS